MFVVILTCIDAWEAILSFMGKMKGLGIPPWQMLKICSISTKVRIPLSGNESAQETFLHLYKAASMSEVHTIAQRKGRWM